MQPATQPCSTERLVQVYESPVKSHKSIPQKRSTGSDVRPLKRSLQSTTCWVVRWKVSSPPSAPNPSAASIFAIIPLAVRGELGRWHVGAVVIPEKTSCGAVTKRSRHCQTAKSCREYSVTTPPVGKGLERLILTTALCGALVRQMFD